MNLLKDIGKTLEEYLGTLLTGDVDSYANSIRIEQHRIFIEMTYDYHVVGRWVREFNEFKNDIVIYKYYVADTGSCRFEANDGTREICVSFM